LTEQEVEHGRGEEKEALIDWYLEKKEGEGAIENLEELEMEKELIGKVIAKLVKDNYLIAINEDIIDLPSQEEEESAGTSAVEGTSLGSKRLVYMVHPSVDADSSSYA